MGLGCKILKQQFKNSNIGTTARSMFIQAQGERATTVMHCTNTADLREWRRGACMGMQLHALAFDVLK